MLSWPAQNARVARGSASELGATLAQECAPACQGFRGRTVMAAHIGGWAVTPSHSNVERILETFVEITYNWLTFLLVSSYWDMALIAKDIYRLIYYSNNIASAEELLFYNLPKVYRNWYENFSIERYFAFVDVFPVSFPRDTCYLPYRWVLIEAEGCHECPFCIHTLLDTTKALEQEIMPTILEFEVISS